MSSPANGEALSISAFDNNLNSSNCSGERRWASSIRNTTLRCRSACWAASRFAGLLIGQPTLATRLRQGIFAALDRRISVRYAIGGMDLAESVGYLRHHLELAGRTDQLIADDAAARLHRYANGIPRALNNAAMAGLMAAAADGKGLVDDLCAKKAVAELTRT